MAFKQALRTRQYVTSTGTIDVAAVLQLGGVTNIDLNTFVQSVGDGNQTAVCIVSGNGVDWQECFVTVDDASPDTLTVDEIIQTSIAGVIGTTPITLAGTSRVFGIIITDFQKLFDKLFGATNGVMVRDDVNGWYGTTTLRLNSFAIYDEDSPNGTTFVIEHYADSQDPATAFPFIATRAANGTAATPLDITEDARLGGYGFYGWQGGNWRLGASIQSVAREDWTGSARGTSLLFSVTPLGDIVPVFPLELTEDALLLNGVPVATGTGTGVTFTNGGAWSGTVAYDKGTFVTRSGAIYLARVDVAAPAGTPGVDGSVHVASSGTVTIALPGLSTGGSPDTIAVVVAWNDSAALLTSITSTSGLTFVQKTAAVKTIITGHKIRLELWTAPVTGAITNEIITLHHSSAPLQTKAVAFGVNGGDISDPFDANANSLKTNTGDRTVPGVTGFTTSNANDLILFAAASDSDGGAGIPASAAPSTYTLMNFQGVASDASSNNVNLAVSYKLVSATQSAVAISDSGDPSCWAAIAIGIKASGAVNPAPNTDSRWITVDAGTPPLASTDLDLVLGSTRGAIPYRGASGWTSRNPGTAGYVWTSAGTGADPDWAASAGGGVAGGNTPIIPRIYKPTKVSSGFNNTLVGSGTPTSVDTEVGILLTCSGASGNFSYRTPPATPYEFTALFSCGPVNGSVPFFGFSDGTKYQVLYCPNISFTDAGKSIVISYSSIGVFNATHATVITGTHGDRVWMRIGDDGTNVSFKVSLDGVNFVTIYTVAKASGYLGASGYTRVVFGSSAAGALVTLMSFDDGTGNLGTLVTGSGGLYRQSLSATPTIALVGMNTWTNQGTATITEDPIGLTIFAPSGGSDSLRMRRKAITGNFTITALLDIDISAVGNYAIVGLGFHDPSANKTQAIEFGYGAGWLVRVGSYSSLTAFNVQHGTSITGLERRPVWLRIKYDGTNIIFQVSLTGAESSFRTLYSVTPASGYLGASGYGNVEWHVNAISRDVYGTMLHYNQA